MDNEKLTDQELAELDKRGLKLDWPEYEYDHNCKEWAIGLNTGDGQ